MIAPHARAIGRSLRIYHSPGRDAVLDAFYRRFLGPDDIAFDVGAHVGDRAGSFCRLGARVLAVEPQPRLARLLRLILPDIHVVQALVGATKGHAQLALNSANPTVATASPDFIAAAAGAPGWEGQTWDSSLTLPVTTLDTLAAAHGFPAFVKIDVEGYEAMALAGLTTAPRALSFEFTTIQRDVALACLTRLTMLGYRAFNACLGESMVFAHAAPLDADAMAAWITALPMEANSGDVYASMEPERIT